MATVQGEPVAGSGLTTTKAPFIEQAQLEGRLYIHQPYELYSEANHEAWRKLFARMEDRWRRYANHRFLQGIDSLCLEPTRVPRLEDVNRFLSPLTGFKAKAVSGYIPSFLFFNSLRSREFPTTITIRDGATLDYLPEPDIFHDIAGHVPMHTDRAFADTLVRFGDCAHTAAEIVAGIKDEKEKIRRVTSIFKAMARFFWFTIEFGLMRGNGDLKVYGSGLLSSMERSRTPSSLPKFSAIPSSWSGSSTSTSRSITINRFCSSSTPSIISSTWWVSSSGGCVTDGWTTCRRASRRSVSRT
jgi:phenylalanine-4-hydroxylase